MSVRLSKVKPSAAFAAMRHMTRFKCVFCAGERRLVACLKYETVDEDPCE